jgi:uncharacterized membrane protein (TIGR02234 family)
MTTGQAAIGPGSPTGDSRRMFATALLLDLIGGGAALLIAGRPWQTVTVSRPRPLADELVHLSGKTLQPGVFGLALVALAGVVAVLATKRLGRRIVGTALVLAGALLVWRAASGLAEVSPAQARSLAVRATSSIGVDGSSAVHLTHAPAWPLLTIVCGLLVIGSGLLVAVRGARWTVMSARYDAPLASARPQTDAALWTALDRGDDPTA